MIAGRDFLGEDFYKWALQDYEGMRALRNSVSKGRRPTPDEAVQLKVNKPWEKFYERILT